MLNQKFDQVVSGTAVTGREWWQLNMIEVQQRADMLGWRGSPKQGIWTCLGWNDRGAIKIDDCELTRAELMLLVSELGRLISESGIDVARLPDMNCVRRGTAVWQDLANPTGERPGDEDFDPMRADVVEVETELLVVDVEFDDFVVPAVATLSFLGTRASITDIATRMVRTVALERKFRRGEVDSREVRFRNALVNASTNSGAIVPLWLRTIPQHPLVLDTSDPQIEVITLELDENLLWELREDRIAWHENLEFSDQRLEELQRRATTKALVERTGYGLVCGVAQALMDEYDMDLRQVFKDLWKARSAGQPSTVKVGNGPARETLILDEGVLKLQLEFEGGRYTSGNLQLFGRYPLSVEVASKGQVLAKLVDHPAFRRAGVVVSGCQAGEDSFQIYHDVQTSPIATCNRGGGVPGKK